MSGSNAAVAVLALEIETDPDDVGGFITAPNLVPNPQGDLGGWGWLTPIGNTAMAGDGALTLSTAVTQAVYTVSEAAPVTGGYVKGMFTLGSSGSLGTEIKGRFVFYDQDGAVLSMGTQTAAVLDNGSATLPLTAVPGGTFFAALRLDFYHSGGNAQAGDTAVITLAAFVHLDADPGATPVQIGSEWINILGSSNEIKVAREELNLGTLTASVVSTALDPSKDDTIRPGRRIRLTASGEVLFYGTITNGHVVYAPLEPDKTRRALITVSAVDNVPPLARRYRSNGVATVAELATVVEGCGVPWNLNGDTSQTALTPVVVAQNDHAMALDQVAITRDSLHAYAWVDRQGVLQVWDAAEISTTTALTVSEADYSDGIGIDYDTDRCINVVTIKFLRINPGTGETEEVPYGPYQDDASVREWGPHTAEFTIQGVTEDAATIKAYADAVLSANGTPQVRVNTLTLPITTSGEATSKALVDLYDLVRVRNSTGVNLVRGSDFEGADAPFYSIFAGSAFSPFNYEQQHEGHRSAKVSKTSGSTWGVQIIATDPTLTDEYLPGDGRPLMASAWIKGTAGQVVTVKGDWTATSGSWSGTGSPVNVTLTGGWQRAIVGPFSFTGSPATPVMTFTSTGADPFWIDQVQIEGGTAATDWSARPDWIDSTHRVVGIVHEITTDGTTHKWLTDLTFAADGSVAAPTVVPSPQAATNGQTVAELLRPVGEVTLWAGASAGVPAGWLVCDGSTFSSGTYPELATLLGGTTLPDLRDRFPIGASGTKALGSTGGAATKAVPPHTHSTPNHTHTHNLTNASIAHGGGTVQPGTGTAVNRVGTIDGANNGTHTHAISGGITSSGGGTTGAESGAAFDVMPPWRALHFIIRAA